MTEDPSICVYHDVAIPFPRDRKVAPQTSSLGVNTLAVPPLGEDQCFQESADAYRGDHQGIPIRTVADTIRTSDAREHYVMLCQQTHCRVNPQLVRSIPQGLVLDEVHSLGTEGTYTGEKQLRPYLTLLSACRHLTRLELTDQYLTPATIQDIAERCSVHPSLTSLNLSHNFIEYPEAKLLIRMLKKNPRILHLHLKHTSIQGALMAEVERILRMTPLERTSLLSK